MKGNEGATVAFEWDTETLTAIKKISNLKLIKCPFLPYIPRGTEREVVILFVFPKHTFLNVASIEVTFVAKST
jgi:hypothetical protein